MSGDKIVLIAPHDPLLALVGDRRIAQHIGGIAAPIVTGEAERPAFVNWSGWIALLAALERLRRGACLNERIDFVSAASMTDHGSTRSLS